MFSQELIEQKLGELNAAWHACTKSGEGNDINEMQRTVTRLDTAQDWFKNRNIKLDYNGETGDHSLSTEQPTWRNPSSSSTSSYGDYLAKLEQSRRRHSRWF